jgi:hypothetical protein
LLEAIGYAPLLKAVLLLGMVPVVLARCWLAVARRVMQPESRALADMLRMRYAQIDRRLKHASHYAPEMEHRRQQWAPYVAFVAHGFLAFICVFVALYSLLTSVLFLGPMMGTWYMSRILLFPFCFFVILWRFEFTAATWAWHSIKTGSAFTWPNVSEAVSSPAPSDESRP